MQWKVCHRIGYNPILTAKFQDGAICRLTFNSFKRSNMHVALEFLFNRIL